MPRLTSAVTNNHQITAKKRGLTSHLSWLMITNQLPSKEASPHICRDSYQQERPRLIYALANYHQTSIRQKGFVCLISNFG